MWWIQKSTKWPLERCLAEVAHAHSGQAQVAAQCVLPKYHTSALMQHGLRCRYTVVRTPTAPRDFCISLCQLHYTSTSAMSSRCKLVLKDISYTFKLCAFTLTRVILQPLLTALVEECMRCAFYMLIFSHVAQELAHQAGLKLTKLRHRMYKLDQAIKGQEDALAGQAGSADKVISLFAMTCSQAADSSDFR